MVKVYCYSKCTTCKKALKWLDDNNIKYNFDKNFKKHMCQAISGGSDTVAGQKRY